MLPWCDDAAADAFDPQNYSRLGKGRLCVETTDRKPLHNEESGKAAQNVGADTYPKLRFGWQSTSLLSLWFKTVVTKGECGYLSPSTRFTPKLSRWKLEGELFSHKFKNLANIMSTSFLGSWPVSKISFYLETPINIHIAKFQEWCIKEEVWSYRESNSYRSVPSNGLTNRLIAPQIGVPGRVPTCDEGISNPPFYATELRALF